MRIGGLRQFLGKQDGWKRWSQGGPEVRRRMYREAAQRPVLTEARLEKMMIRLWKDVGAEPTKLSVRRSTYEAWKRWTDGRDQASPLPALRGDGMGGEISHKLADLAANPRLPDEQRRHSGRRGA
jgi:hypothetical protein